MFLEFLIEHWTLAGAWMVLLWMILYHENRKSGESVSPQKLSSLVNKHDGHVLDVRESREFSQGHITGSTNIPYKDLEKRMSELKSYKDKPVIVVCKIGQHSGSATKMLRQEGFEQLYKLQGGISEWKASNLPLVKKD